MAIPLLLGLLLGTLFLLVPLRRARRATDVAEQARLKFGQDRQRLLEFMHLMTEALGEGLSTAELQQRVVHAAIVCTGALSGAFFELTDRDTMRRVAVEGLFPPHRPLSDEVKSTLTTRAKFVEQVLKAEEFPIAEGMVGRVARTRRGELLADATTDPTMVKHDDPALIVRSVIVVPLIFQERFFGVLAVANPAGEARFTPDDFGLLESLGEQAALALRHAETLTFERERQQLDLDLSVASSVQHMLLPRESLRCEGLEINARYVPAQKVSGDLYDTFPVGPNRVAVVVADVSGKGIGASLLMAICRTHLRQIAPRHTSPAAVLTELNRAVEPDLQNALYVTLLFAIVDVLADTITFARAGHELPLLVRRDRGTGRLTTQFVASEGMGVGLVPDAVFAEVIEDRTERFSSGDVCVLYTDGLTETPNEDGKEFSGARLVDAVRSAYDGGAGELNDGILRAVERFKGDTPQRDDFTLVTVKRV